MELPRLNSAHSVKQGGKCLQSSTRLKNNNNNEKSSKQILATWKA